MSAQGTQEPLQRQIEELEADPITLAYCKDSQRRLEDLQDSLEATGPSGARG
jgi:hypothetical protein